jgi:hypothetical protein
MGLKGYRLWVMGQLDSNVQSPTEDVRLVAAHGEGLPLKHEHRLDEDEIKATPLVQTFRAEQWESSKATRNPTQELEVRRRRGVHERLRRPLCHLRPQCSGAGCI